MKTSVIYLGIALVTFTNVISALGQQSFITEESLAVSVQAERKSEKVVSVDYPKERNRTTEKKSAMIDAETIPVPSFQKTIEEIIAENNQIIESNLITESNTQDSLFEVRIDASPLNSEKTMEEIIAQDSEIIENPVINAILPATSGKTRK